MRFRGREWPVIGSVSMTRVCAKNDFEGRCSRHKNAALRRYLARRRMISSCDNIRSAGKVDELSPCAGLFYGTQIAVHLSRRFLASGWSVQVSLHAFPARRDQTLPFTSSACYAALARFTACSRNALDAGIHVPYRLKSHRRSGCSR